MTIEHVRGVAIIRHTETDNLISVYRDVAHLGMIYPALGYLVVPSYPLCERWEDRSFPTEAEALAYLESLT
jgi:hypothetical protein